MTSTANWWRRLELRNDDDDYYDEEYHNHDYNDDEYDNHEYDYDDYDYDDDDECDEDDGRRTRITDKNDDCDEEWWWLGGRSDVDHGMYRHMQACLF